MNQAPQGGPTAEALEDLRNAAFERARYARDCASWYYDAAKAVPIEFARLAAQYEAMAAQEENFIQRVDMTIQGMAQAPAAPQPQNPQAFLRQLDGQPPPQMTTAPGEAARTIGGPKYRSGAADDGHGGGIAEAEPTPQTVVESVSYQKGEPRPREFRTGHMDTRPRSAQELRAYRDKLREQQFQKWLAQQMAKPVSSIQLSLDAGDEGIQVVRVWRADELEESEVMFVELQDASTQDAAQYTGEIAYACEVTFEDGKSAKKALRVMGSFVDPGAQDEQDTSAVS